MGIFLKQFIIIFLLIVLFFGFLSKLVLAENKKSFINCNFTRTLKITMRGLDVFCLQVFLYKEGFLKDILKSPAYYDLNTKKAVIEWQNKNQIFPANGIFDARSIDFYNKHYKEIESLLKPPEVKDDEIQISPTGYSDILEYLKFYFTGINFNKDPNLSQFFQDISKEIEEKKKVPSFFSFVYIKDYLDGNKNNLTEINKRLLFLKRFYEVRIEELKKIKIAFNLKDIHKKFLVHDYLEIILIDKFFEYQQGKISKGDMVKILKEYEDFRAKLSREIQNIILSFNKTKSNYSLFFYSIINKLFFIKETKAITLPFIPFGGIITVVIPCPCSFGFTIIISPPVPAAIYVPFPFLASPLNFMWKLIVVPGVWALGLYFPGAPPCLIFTEEECIPIFQPIGTIFMSGTSLLP